jgi:hypothetical protein
LFLESAHLLVGISVDIFFADSDHLQERPYVQTQASADLVCLVDVCVFTVARIVEGELVGVQEEEVVLFERVQQVLQANLLDLLVELRLDFAS